MEGSMIPRKLLRLSRILIVMSVAISTACDRKQGVCSDHLRDSEVVDPALMAFLSRARAAHHEADLHEDSAEASLRPLLELVNGPIPGQPGKLPAEVREVLADTAARIADLESTLERFDIAIKRIEDALPLVSNASYFRGHLFETRGLVEQRWATSLEKQGNVAQANVVKARALQSFETAMEIQALVIRGTEPKPTGTDASNPTTP
jgi:hypothetical protein